MSSSEMEPYKVSRDMFSSQESFDEELKHLKEDLVHWGQMPTTNSEYFHRHTAMGGAEIIAINLSLVKAAERGPVALEKLSDALVANTLAMLVNNGVVGALIMSLAYPIVFESDISVATASSDFFGESAADALRQIFQALVVTTLMIASLLTYSSVRGYAVLSFWLAPCDYRAKLGYLFSNPLRLQIILQILVVCTTTISVAVGTAAVLSPTIGLVAILGFLLMIVGGMVYLSMTSDTNAIKLLHAQAALLGSESLPDIQTLVEKAKLGPSVMAKLEKLGQLELIDLALCLEPSDLREVGLSIVEARRLILAAKSAFNM